MTIPEIPEEGLMDTRLGATPPWALLKARESKELSLQDKHGGIPALWRRGQRKSFPPSHCLLSQWKSEHEIKREKYSNNNNNLSSLPSVPRPLISP